MSDLACANLSAFTSGKWCYFSAKKAVFLFTIGISSRKEIAGAFTNVTKWAISP